MLVCGIFLPHSNSASAEGNDLEKMKLSSELLDVMDITYEQLLSGDFEDSGDSYSCIIWIKDIDMTVAVEAGIDAAEKTRATYIEGTNYEYPYTVMEIDGNTIVDVNLGEDESDLYVQTYIENERATASKLCY